MTTSRALLMRLLTRGRIHPALHEEHRTAEPPAEQRLEAAGVEILSAEPPAEQRLEAARERLKQTIPPPEGLSPEGGSPPAFRDPPPKV